MTWLEHRGSAFRRTTFAGLIRARTRSPAMSAFPPLFRVEQTFIRQAKNLPGLDFRTGTQIPSQVDLVHFLGQGFSTSIGSEPAYWRSAMPMAHELPLQALDSSRLDPYEARLTSPRVMEPARPQYIRSVSAEALCRALGTPARSSAPEQSRQQS